MAILPICAFNSSTTTFICCHFHETKATAAVGGLVHNDLGRSNLSKRCKKFLEVLVLYGVRDVGDVNVHEFY